MRMFKKLDVWRHPTYTKTSREGGDIYEQLYVPYEAYSSEASARFCSLLEEDASALTVAPGKYDHHHH